jgi:hypothetical protein
MVPIVVHISLDGDPEEFRECLDEVSVHELTEDVVLYVIRQLGHDLLVHFSSHELVLVVEVQVGEVLLDLLPQLDVDVDLIVEVLKQLEEPR